MNWKVKGIIQKVLSHIPGGVAANDRLQRTFGGLRHFESNIADKVNDWKLTFGYLAELQLDVKDTTILEIGTGWYPVLPLCFSLAGAGCVKTYDILAHLDYALTRRALIALKPHLHTIALTCQMDEARIVKQYEALFQVRSVPDLLEVARIVYHAPADATATPEPSNSVDLVYSNSVMEHVPAETILKMMDESARILKPGGIALHNIGCNDHYAFTDRKISFVNYLQFTDAKWRLWNNSLQYQNRLRAAHFLEMSAQAGLELMLKRTHIRPGTLEALHGLRIAPEFQRFPTEELAYTTLDFASRKPMTPAHLCETSIGRP